MSYLFKYGLFLEIYVILFFYTNMKTQGGTSLIIKMKQYNNEKYEILNDN